MRANYRALWNFHFSIYLWINNGANLFYFSAEEGKSKKMCFSQMKNIFFKQAQKMLSVRRKTEHKWRENHIVNVALNWYLGLALRCWGDRKQERKKISYPLFSQKLDIIQILPICNAWIRLSIHLFLSRVKCYLMLKIACKLQKMLLPRVIPT